MSQTELNSEIVIIYVQSKYLLCWLLCHVGCYVNKNV